jgi:hypothetical protein
MRTDDRHCDYLRMSMKKQKHKPGGGGGGGGDAVVMIANSTDRMLACLFIAPPTTARPRVGPVCLLVSTTRPRHTHPNHGILWRNAEEGQIKSQWNDGHSAPWTIPDS